MATKTPPIPPPRRSKLFARSTPAEQRVVSDSVVKRMNDVLSSHLHESFKSVRLDAIFGSNVIKNDIPSLDYIQAVVVKWISSHTKWKQVFHVYVSDNENAELVRDKDRLMRFLDLVSHEKKWCVRLGINLKDMDILITQRKYEEEWLKWDAKQSRVVTSSPLLMMCRRCNGIVVGE